MWPNTEETKAYLHFGYYLMKHSDCLYNSSERKLNVGKWTVFCIQ